MGDRQRKQAPPLDQDLVGRKLEIHWRYWRAARPGERGKKKQVQPPSIGERLLPAFYVMTCLLTCRYSFGARAQWLRSLTAPYESLNARVRHFRPVLSAFDGLQIPSSTRKTFVCVVYFEPVRLVPGSPSWLAMGAMRAQVVALRRCFCFLTCFKLIMG